MKKNVLAVICTLRDGMITIAKGIVILFAFGSLAVLIHSKNDTNDDNWGLNDSQCKTVLYDRT